MIGTDELLKQMREYKLDRALPAHVAVAAEIAALRARVEAAEARAVEAEKFRKLEIDQLLHEREGERDRAEAAERKLATTIEALTYYVDQFCEFPEMEGCGKYLKDVCSGCFARAALAGEKPNPPSEP